MKKKLIALILSVSVPILLRPPIVTKAYVNNGYTNYSLNSLYGYSDNYNNDLIMNLLFNKYKDSILSSNSDFYELYTAQSRYILSNDNLIAKNILLNNGHTLSSLALSNDTYIIEEVIEDVSTEETNLPIVLDNSTTQSTTTNNTSEVKNSVTASITSTTYDTYTITVKNLPSNAVKVRFPTWTAASSNQEDLKWNIMTLPSGATSYSFTVNRADYNFNNTHFVTDVYIEYSNGTMTSIQRLEHGFSKIYTEVSSSNSSSYTVTAYNIPSKMSAVQFPTWTVVNGQDDIKWYTATNKGNGTWSYTVNRSDHNNEKGLYASHTYVVLNGSKKGAGNNIEHNFSILLTNTAIEITGQTDGKTYKKDNSTIYVQPNTGEIILDYYSNTDAYYPGYRPDSNYFYVYNVTNGNTLTQKLLLQIPESTLGLSNAHKFTLNNGGISKVIGSYIARNSQDLKSTSTRNRIHIAFSAKDTEYIIAPHSEIYISNDFTNSSAFYTDTGEPNLSKGVKVITDGTSPTITVTSKPSTMWTNKDVTVSFTSSDSGSGVSENNIYYTVMPDNIEYKLANTNTATFTEEGRYMVELHTQDNVGNQYITPIEENIYFAIDKTAPTFTSGIPIDNSTATGSYRLGIIAKDNDNGSGMKSVTLYKNGSTVATGTDSISYTETTVGSHTFKIVAEDVAGNTTEQTFTIRVVGPPSADLVEVSGYNYKESNSIYWVRQNASGALQIKTKAYLPSILSTDPTETQVALSTSNYVAGTTSTSSASTSGMVASGSEFASNFTLNSTSEKAVLSTADSQRILTATHKLTALLNNKDYKVYVGGKTSSTLQSAFKDVGVTIKTDGTAPTITETAAIPSGWTNKNVTITFNSTDSRSGVKNNQIKYTGTNTAPTEVTLDNTKTYTFTGNDTYSVTLVSTDNVGNTSKKTGSFGIDKILPVINNVPANNSVYGGSATLNLSATDSGGSGMKSITLYKNNTSVATGTSSLSYTENTVGASTFKVVAVDNAGNTTEKTFTLTVVKKPTIDSLSVTKYDYKESDSIYWVRPNVSGVLQIKTQAYFPSSYGIYPTETQLGLGKLNYASGTSSLAWATTSGTGSSGSEFTSNFTLNNGSNKATTSSSNNKNILTFTHTLTPKLDNADYRLYSSGKYNSEQADFVNSSILIKTDGTAPTITETAAIPSGWTNKNVTVTFNSTDSRSGVKSNQIKYTGTNTAPTEVTLNNTKTVTFTETDSYSVTLISTDNVGNISKKTGSFGIDKIAPTLSNIPTNNSEYLDTTTIKINASDTGGSGIKSVTLYRDGAVVNTGTSSATYTETTVGSHTYKVIAQDVAGNTTEKSFTLTINKKPTVDSLSVTKYDYKESNSVYWVRPNVTGVLQIKTQSSYPTSYGIYPTETQLGLGKLNYTSGTSSLAWATTSGTGSSGSEFASNFTLNNGSNKATTSTSDGNNILSFTHTLTPKLDNTDYRLYSSGKYNNVQADFVNSSILIKTDGTAPTITETAAIPSGWTNKDVTVTFNSTDSRSGVKNNQIKYTGKNTAPTEVTLNNTKTVTFTETDSYNVTLISTDNVGNTTQKTGSFGIDKIKPVIGTTPSNGTEYLDMTTLKINSTDDGGSLMKTLTLYRNNVKVAEGIDSVTYFENVNGTHKFKVVAEDNAGNITEKEFTITILEDSIDLITIPNNPKNLIRLEWSHQNLLNKSYTVYQKRDDESVFNVVPGTGDTFTQRVLDNTYASDVTPPNIPNVSFIEETDTNVKYTILPTEDNGTTYEFYVVSKDNYGKLTQSNTATDTVKTGVKGYTYIVDGNTNTIPDKTVDVTVDVSEIIAPIQDNFDHYLHIAAIDNAGNMGPVNHIKIWEAVENNWFNQEIAKQVGKDYSDLRISDYRSIEIITLRNKGIVGEIPKDIKKTINLLELDLYKNSIDDISNLKDLNKLEYLQLGNNQISDISNLKGLTGLTDLNIYNNNISDISIVAQMPNLQRLYLHKNNITDISAVENLNNLEELYFELNYIDLTDPTTIRIIEKFETKGCYVVSSPQNIVRANENDIVELNIGDEFIPKTILGLSENNADIIGEYSILRNSEVNYISSDKNIVDIQNNKLVALSEGEVTITVVHKQFRSIATVSFTVKVIDPNNNTTEDTSNDIEDVNISEEVYNEDNNDAQNDTSTEIDNTFEEITPSENESETIIDNKYDKEKDDEEEDKSTTIDSDNEDSSDIELSSLE